MSNSFMIVLIMAVPVLLILTAWLIKTIIDKINEESGIHLEEHELDVIRQYISMIENNTYMVIRSLNQTVVEELRAKNEDGRLTAEDAENIRNIAVERLRGMIDDDIIEIIYPITGDICTFLGDLVESAVKAIKNSDRM